MELCQEKFQSFIDTVDPFEFLEMGNEGVENLQKFLSFKILEVKSEHIAVLIDIIFLQKEGLKPGFPFFAAQLLEKFALTLGDRFLDADLIAANFDLLNKNNSNLTSCAYFCQFLKPLLGKRSKIIEKVLQDQKVISVLLSSVQSLNICSLVRDYIEIFPASCKSVLQGLLSIIQQDEIQRAAPCCEVLKSAIKHLDAKTITHVFKEEVISKLLHPHISNKRYCLSLINELLSLPRANRSRNLALRVLSDHIPQVLQDLRVSTGETLLETLITAKSAVLSDFGSLSYLLGTSLFMQVATVINKKEKTFAAVWNSQLHLAYFELVQEVIRSNSNYLISSILTSGLIKVLLCAAENPSMIKGKVTVRKGFMGFVTKIGCLLRDCKVEAIKNFLKTVDGWEAFLIYVNTQEAVENKVLGGRVRLRHMTSQEILEYLDEGVDERAEEEEVFYEKNFWSVCVEDFEEED